MKRAILIDVKSFLKRSDLNRTQGAGGFWVQGIIHATTCLGCTTAVDKAMRCLFPFLNGQPRLVDRRFENPPASFVA